MVNNMVLVLIWVIHIQSIIQVIPNGSRRLHDRRTPFRRIIHHIHPIHNREFSMVFNLVAGAKVCILRFVEGGGFSAAIDGIDLG